ncbi:MAG: phosphoadenosine phosphosulfate reductase family protein [Rhodobacteraceae bacterium]|nr:phosphoadenosine phosphosulfate reductase family protein [Gammaproteobacteria bacterium]MCY4327554.1 phosphoadenosine phosphosulfate reductase family protein [Paracoccaceae bacterium]
MRTRHIIGISGGKDSAALAIYLTRKREDWRYFRDLAAEAGCSDAAREIETAKQAPEIESFFTDTGKELPEVYEYLEILEKYLDKPIVRLSPFSLVEDDNTAPFDHFLWAEHGGLLPSRHQRWCTYKMKIKPMGLFVGDAPTVNYVGIRADESSRSKLSSLTNVTAVYPFMSDGLVRQDIVSLLEETTGLPKYYSWRSRSGCYFCFFQRKSEWLGLREHHPDLFEKAMRYENETFDPNTGRMYTWMDRMSLAELEEEASSMQAGAEMIASDRQSTWQADLISDHLSDDDRADHACAVCSI